MTHVCQTLSRSCQLLLGVGLWIAPEMADAAKSDPAGRVSVPLESHLKQGEELAQALTLVTGISISPLLGVSVLGAVRYFEAEPLARSALPWYGQPWFWGSGMALALLFAANTAIGTLVPGLKKPMDVVEEWENKLSAVLASPVAIAELLNLGANVAGKAIPISGSPGALAAVPDPGWQGGFLEAVSSGMLAAGGVGVFAVVFLLAHGIQVLILLSPSAELDLLLRTGRALLVGGLLALSECCPWIGLLIAAPLVVIAVVACRFSLRLLRFASTFSSDLLLRKKEEVTGGSWLAFWGADFAGFPFRQQGRLIRKQEELFFRTRRGVLRRERERRLGDCRGFWLRVGWLGPSVVVRDSEGAERVVVRLPPRYRGQEVALVREVGLAGSVEGRWRMTLREFRRWVASLWGSRNPLEFR